MVILNKVSSKNNYLAFINLPCACDGRVPGTIYYTCQSWEAFLLQGIPKVREKPEKLWLLRVEHHCHSFKTSPRITKIGELTCDEVLALWEFDPSETSPKGPPVEEPILECSLTNRCFKNIDQAPPDSPV